MITCLSALFLMIKCLIRLVRSSEGSLISDLQLVCFITSIDFDYSKRLFTSLLIYVILENLFASSEIMIWIISGQMKFKQQNTIDYYAIPGRHIGNQFSETANEDWLCSKMKNKNISLGSIFIPFRLLIAITEFIVINIEICSPYSPYCLYPMILWIFYRLLLLSMRIGKLSKRTGRECSPFSIENCSRLYADRPFPKFIVGSQVWLVSKILFTLEVKQDINW